MTGAFRVFVSCLCMFSRWKKCLYCDPLLLEFFTQGIRLQCPCFNPKTNTVFRSEGDWMRPQENVVVIANTLSQQHKRRLCTWTSPEGQHWNQIDYIICSQRWRSSIESAKTRPGADCGSDHELLIPKFRLKLKKVRKTTRPFRYDLNQIPYDYTVEVRNRFKGLDLIDKSAWWTMDWGSLHCTGNRDQDHPHGKETQKSKMAVWRALQIAVKRREVESKGEKERYKHLNASSKE